VVPTTTRRATPPRTAAQRTTAPRTTTTAKSTPKTTAPKPAAAYYANCAAVQAAGAAPIRRGQPGYRAGLDRDGDGVGCAGD